MKKQLSLLLLLSLACQFGSSPLDAKRRVIVEMDDDDQDDYSDQEDSDNDDDKEADERENEGKMTQALKKAQQKIDVFVKQYKKDIRRSGKISVKAEDASKALVDYLSSYKSWYQAVTPAPRGIVVAVGSYPPAMQFIRELMKIVDKNFVRKYDRDLLGASRITKAGDEFFQKARRAYMKALKIKGL